MGWMKVIRWFGCIGMAFSSLAFYYIQTFEKIVVKKKAAHTWSHSEVVKPSSSTNIIGIIRRKWAG
jgi:hypothetical protein